MITDFIGGIFDVSSAVISGIGDMLASAITLVYDAAITPFGYLVLLVGGVPLAWSLLTYVVSLFTKATKVKGK